MTQRQLDASDAADGTERRTDSDAADGTRPDVPTDTASYPSERVCPECDAPCVVRDGGCPTCRACGWSKCAYSPL